MRGCAGYLLGCSWLVGAGSLCQRPDGTDFVCFESSAREIALGGGRGPTAEAGLPYRKDAPCGRYELCLH